MSDRYGSANLRADGGETDGLYEDDTDRVRCHNYDDEGVMCGDEATDLIRPKGGNGGVVGWQGRQLFGARIPVCSLCGEYLVEEAEIDWEFNTRKIEPSELAERASLPDSWGRYDEYDGLFQPDEDGPSSTETDRSGGQP